MPSYEELIKAMMPPAPTKLDPLTSLPEEEKDDSTKLDTFDIKPVDPSTVPGAEPEEPTEDQKLDEAFEKGFQDVDLEGTLKDLAEKHLDFDKYKDYFPEGQVYASDINALNRARGAAQGGGEQFVNMLTQLGLGEMIGGTLEGIGYLSHAASALDIFGGDSDYSLFNPQDQGVLEEMGTNIKDWTKEYAPIYQRDPGGYNFFDSGWWAENMVSVGSTVSLMIPAMGATKALGMLGKGFRMLSKTKKLKRIADMYKAGTITQQAATEMSMAVRAGRPFASMMPGATKNFAQFAMGTGNVFLQAGISRHGESMMEAAGVAKEVFEEKMSLGIFTEEEAKQMAGKAAADVYKKNWAMIMQDVMQFAVLAAARGKKIPGALKKSKKVKGKWDPGVLKKPGALLGTMASEGLIEEGYQHIIAEEAKYMSDVDAGLVEGRGGVLERLDEYATSGDFWTAVTFGAIGAGVFQGAGVVGGKLKDKFKDKYNFFKDVDSQGNLKGMITEEELQEKGFKQSEQFDEYEDVTNAEADVKAVYEYSKRTGEILKQIIGAQEAGASILDLTRSLQALGINMAQGNLENLERLKDGFASASAELHELREKAIQEGDVEVQNEIESKIAAFAQVALAVNEFEKTYESESALRGPELAKKTTPLLMENELFNTNIQNANKAIREGKQGLPREKDLSPAGDRALDSTLELRALELYNKKLLPHFANNKHVSKEQQEYFQKRKTEVETKIAELKKQLSSKGEIGKELTAEDRKILKGAKYVNEKVNKTYAGRLLNEDLLDFNTEKLNKWTANPEQTTQKAAETVEKKDTENKEAATKATNEAQTNIQNSNDVDNVAGNTTSAADILKQAGLQGAATAEQEDTGAQPGTEEAAPEAAPQTSDRVADLLNQVAQTSDVIQKVNLAYEAAQIEKEESSGTMAQEILDNILEQNSLELQGKDELVGKETSEISSEIEQTIAGEVKEESVLRVTDVIEPRIEQVTADTYTTIQAGRVTVKPEIVDTQQDTATETEEQQAQKETPTKTKEELIEERDQKLNELNTQKENIENEIKDAEQILREVEGQITEEEKEQLEEQPERKDQISEGVNETIRMARAGNKTAQEALEDYGIDYSEKPVYRFVSQSEIDALEDGKRIEGKNKTVGVDVTSNSNPTTATSAEYRVSFKEEFDYNLEGRAVQKNEKSGDGWIRGGYTKEDVSKIEKRNSDGTYTVIYDATTKEKPTTPEVQEETPEENQEKQDRVSKESFFRVRNMSGDQYKNRRGNPGERVDTGYDGISNYGGEGVIMDFNQVTKTKPINDRTFLSIVKGASTGKTYLSLNIPAVFRKNGRVEALALMLDINNIEGLNPIDTMRWYGKAIYNVLSSNNIFVENSDYNNVVSETELHKKAEDVATQLKKLWDRAIKAKTLQSTEASTAHLNEVEKELKAAVQNNKKNTQEVVNHVIEEEVKNLSKEEKKAIEEEKHEKESIADFLRNALRGVQKVKSETIKKVLKRIRNAVIYTLLAMSTLGLSGYTMTAQIDSVNKFVKENISEDVAKVSQKSLLDQVDVLYNYFEKKTGLGAYEDIQSSLDFGISEEASEEIFNEAHEEEEEGAVSPEVTTELGDTIPAKKVDHFLSKSMQLGQTVHTKRGNLQTKPFRLDLSYGDKKFAIRKHTDFGPQQGVRNAQGIAVTTHHHFKDAATNKGYLNYPVAIVYNDKDSTISIKKSEDVVDSDQVIIFQKSTFIDVEDLDIKRNDKNGRKGYDLDIGLDGGNGTAIISAYNGKGTFHWGVASSPRAIPKTVNSTDFNDYRTLRGGAAIIMSEDAEQQVIVSGSINDIFSTLAHLQDKHPDKKFYMFRGDTGSFTTSSYTEDGEVSAEDIRMHSNQNSDGKVQYLILLQDQEESEKPGQKPPVDPVTAGLFTMLAAIRRKHRSGDPLTEAEITDLKEGIEALKTSLAGVNNEIAQTKADYRLLLNNLEKELKTGPVVDPLEALSDEVEQVNDLGAMPEQFDVKFTSSIGEQVLEVPYVPYSDQIRDVEELFLTEDNDPNGRVYINMDPLKDILVVPNNTMTIIDTETNKEILKKELNPEGSVLFTMYGGRIMTVANINGQLVPYYKSSEGTSGKNQGEWYPFFGFTGAWLVKDTVLPNGKMPYSDEIDKVAELLNENLVFPDMYMNREDLTIKDSDQQVIIDFKDIFSVNSLHTKEFEMSIGKQSGGKYRVKGLRENTPKQDSAMVALLTGLNPTVLYHSVEGLDDHINKGQEWYDYFREATKAVEGGNVVVEDIVTPSGEVIEDASVPEGYIGEDQDDVIRRLMSNSNTAQGDLESLDTPLNLDEVKVQGKIEKDPTVAASAVEEENGLHKDLPNTIAWKSSGNIWSSGIDVEKNKELSIYLEEPSRNLKDHSFRIEVDVDYMLKNPKVTKKEGKVNRKLVTVDNAKIVEQLQGGEEVTNVGYMVVKATLLENGQEVLDSQGNPFVVYLHDHKYNHWAEKHEQELIRKTEAMKRTIAAEYQKGNTVLIADVKKKHDGKLNSDKDAEDKFILHNLQSTLNVPVENMEFLMGGASKEYLQHDGNLDDDITQVSATPGAIYAKVRTANNTPFPLRLFAENIIEQEAELIRLLYKDMLGNADLFQQAVSDNIKEFIKKNEEPRVSDIARVLNLNTATYKDLLNFLVFEGTRTASKKGSALYVNKKGILRAGNDSFTRDTIDDRSFAFKAIVMQRKRRILGAMLNDNKYKNYIVNNDLVRSNAISPYNTSSILFVQPVIEFGKMNPSKDKNAGKDAKKRLRVFDDNLDAKLKRILAELYPEVLLEYTNEPIPYDPNMLNQKAALKRAQEKARDIFFKEIYNKKLNATQIERLNEKVRALSDQIGDTTWFLREPNDKRKKGTYYIAGYKNAPVTMESYYTPYARDLYYQIAEDSINFRLRVVSKLMEMTQKKPSKYAKKNKREMFTQPNRLTIRKNKLESTVKALIKQGVPREQIEFMHSYMKRNNIQDISTAELALAIMQDYSVAAKVELSTEGVQDVLTEVETDQGTELISESIEGVPTRRYEFLSSPGGTNYREWAIRTPGLQNIISSGEYSADNITGGGYHDGDFNQGRGDMLGWFRAMDVIQESPKEAAALAIEDLEDTSVVKVSNSEGTITFVKNISDSEMAEQGIEPTDLEVSEDEFGMNIYSAPAGEIVLFKSDIEELIEEGYTLKTGQKDIAIDTAKTLALLEIQSGFQKIRDQERIFSRSAKSFDIGSKVKFLKGSPYYREGIFTIQNYQEGGTEFLPEENQYEPTPSTLILTDENGQELIIDRNATDRGMGKDFAQDLKIVLTEEDGFKNSFLQLLNKDNAWIGFFIQTIMQDAAKKGYEKVRFPAGETAAKIEQHATYKEKIENFDREIERYKDLDLNKLKEELEKAELVAEQNEEEIAELEGRMQALIDSAKFEFQEPIPSKTESGFDYSRVQHTDSPIRQKNNDTYLPLLPEGYKGYYIYSYRKGFSGMGTDDINKATPISDEEALEIYNQQDYLFKLNVKDRQEYIHLKEKADVLGNVKEINRLTSDIENFDKVKKLNKERLARANKAKADFLERGIEKGSPIENFYETRIYNILKKKYGSRNIKRVTDKHNRSWFELAIDEKRELSEILLQQTGGTVLGQYDERAVKILIDAVNQKQDTLPHEYAHHYIRMWRNHPIVQEAIKKFGSEEALVQFIGEQAVEQKGEAWSWWKRFTKWILDKMNNLSSMKKEELGKLLTDAFLTRQDLSEVVISEQNKSSEIASIFEELGFEGSSTTFAPETGTVTVKSTAVKEEEKLDPVAKAYIDVINLDLFADKITLTDENFKVMKPEDC